MKILLRNLTGVALKNAMTMVDPRLNPGGSVITDADELLSFLRASFLGPRHDQETMVQWATLKQGTRSVLEFTNEFQLLPEYDMESQFTDTQIAASLGGLNPKLKAKISASKPKHHLAEASSVGPSVAEPRLLHAQPNYDASLRCLLRCPPRLHILPCQPTPAYPTAPYAGMSYQAVPYYHGGN